MWEKLENILKQKNMTIYRLTKLSEVDVSIIYNLKSGRAKDVKLSTAIKIADALGISLDEFR